MKKKVKGVAVITVVLIAAATFAVGVGVGIWMSGQDGGFGGEDEAVPADAAFTEEVTETTTETETTTVLITEVKNAEYIEVTVDGDKYSYNGVFFDLDGFIAEITRDGKKFEVRIYFSDIATQFAYEELVKKLDENDISYTENNE